MFLRTAASLLGTRSWVPVSPRVMSLRRLGASIRYCSSTSNKTTSDSSSSTTAAATGAKAPQTESSPSAKIADHATAGASTSPGGAPPRKIQIAVVGSGPSGCFVADYLTRKHPTIHVDVFEQLPVPFGLCRYGVAPDHPDVKNVEKQIMQLFKSGRVTWIGNVSVGKMLPVHVLLEHYAAVVFSTGAEVSRKLGIPGEELGGILDARDFVNYYNTFPFPWGSPRISPLDFSQTSHAAIIGNGNVAMDLARVLATTYKRFCTTDMNCVAIKELMGNRIRSVDVLARRGPTASAFTIAEFRELTRLPAEDAQVEVDPFNLRSALEESAPNQRARGRMLELVHKFCVDASEKESRLIPLPGGVSAADLTTAPIITADSSDVSVTTSPRAHGGRPRKYRDPCALRFRYHLRPVRFLPSARRRNYVGGVLLERTDVAPTAPEAERLRILPCDTVLKSIGHRGTGIPHLPFDEKKGVIPNVHGRVSGHPRVYCSGWIKNGARGVILHSIVDAQDTVDAILHDIACQLIPTHGTSETAVAASRQTQTTMFGKYGLLDYFVSKRLEPVSIAGVDRILHVEKERGIDLGKRAEKMSSVRDMLDVALGGDIGRKVSDKFRGITPERPEAMLYLKELLDDDTDLAPLAHSLAQELPQKLAENHPPGRISPSQL